MTSPTVSCPPDDRCELALLRVALIRRSLACHVLGWCSLVPWLGMPCALLAWWQGWRARRDEGRVWNPARRYRITGIALAGVGMAISLIGIGAMIAGYWLSL